MGTGVVKLLMKDKAWLQRESHHYLLRKCLILARHLGSWLNQLVGLAFDWCGISGFIGRCPLFSILVVFSCVRTDACILYCIRQCLCVLSKWGVLYFVHFRVNTFLIMYRSATRKSTSVKCHIIKCSCIYRCDRFLVQKIWACNINLNRRLNSPINPGKL